MSLVFSLLRERMEDEVRDPDRNKRAVRAADPNVTEQSTGGESQPQRWYVSQDSMHDNDVRLLQYTSSSIFFDFSLFLL